MLKATTSMEDHTHIWVNWNHLNLQSMNTYYLPFSKTIVRKTMKLSKQAVKIEEHEGDKAIERMNDRKRD
jgi:hypothetical protein